MPNEQIATLFAKLQARYGSKFTSQYAGIVPLALDEWAAELGGLDWNRIEVGLRNWRQSWPPSVYEFREACFGRRDESGGDRHYCPTRNGPEAERITDRSRLLSSDDRDRRRKVAGEQIRNLKAALNGAGSQPKGGE